jgi:hypothetical protein
MPIIPALGRLRQEDWESNTRLGYTARPKRAREPSKSFLILNFAHTLRITLLAEPNSRTLI